VSLSTPSVPELFSACTRLFGPDIHVSIDFLKYLEPSGVRTAYRERVFETHPDRARILGLDERDLTDNFKKINEAYELLSSAVSDKHRLFTSNGIATPERKPGPEPEFRDRYYTGALPRRPLPIGQFLYYSGLISWRNLINAIVLQRRNRPLIGRIARSWNLLNDDEISYILKHRAAGEKFGEYALREGFLTKSDLAALLGKQRLQTGFFCKYFINGGILTPVEVETLVKAQRRHNALWSGRFRER
jgi:hypothetical protein